MKKVFVTGADGLIGSNLVRVLLERNFQVKVLVDSQREASTLNELSVEFVEGDITNSQLLINATEGCDYIVNAESYTNFWPANSSKYFDINVEGTQNIISAALINNVKKIVQVSSANCFEFGSVKKPGEETHLANIGSYGLDYFRSKKDAQDLVLAAVAEKGLPAVVVNPTFIIGAYDKSPFSTNIILDLANKNLKGVNSGGRNWIYAKDVAVGICNAFEVGRIGECYILGNENLSYSDALQRISKTLNKKVPQRKLSNFSTKFRGIMGSLYGMIFKKKPKINYPLAKMVCQGQYYSAAKAREELGLPSTPIEFAALDAYKWFHKNGYLQIN